MVVNLGRLTVIGASVAAWGQGSGFRFGHVYMGSIMTFVGTCVAGIVFAMVLLWHGRPMAMAAVAPGSPWHRYSGPRPAVARRPPGDGGGSSVDGGGSSGAAGTGGTGTTAAGPGVPPSGPTAGGSPWGGRS